MAEVVALVSGRGFLSGNGWKRMLPSGAGKQSDIDASLHILRQLTHAPFSRRGFKAVRSALLSERDRMKDPTDRKPYDTALEELGAREDDPAFAHEPLYRLTDLSCIGINGAQIETLVALRTKLRELVGEEDEVPEARTHENIARALLSGYPDRVFTAQPNKLPGGESSLVHTSHPLAFKFGTSSTVDQLAGTPYFGLPYIIGSE